MIISIEAQSEESADIPVIRLPPDSAEALAFQAATNAVLAAGEVLHLSEIDRMRLIKIGG